MTEIDLYKKLKQIKYRLTRQQYLTLKGQIKKGDLIGANKGIFMCLLNKKNKEGDIK